MDLDRMLDKCHRGQWRVDDLDWSRTPRPLSRAEEIRVVQLLTNMAAIERLAGEMFALQRQRAEADPQLRAIFTSFVRDEHRHARVAERLARFYDVHHYQDYAPDPHLQRFAPRLLRACRDASPVIADLYITTGELLLDVALLRSLDDFVDDPTSHEAMRMINRDESRHVAMDYYLLQRHCREAAEAEARGAGARQASGGRSGAPGLRGSIASAAATMRAWSGQARALWNVANLVVRARPFLRCVLLEPLDACDPSGKRLREVFKRMHLVTRRPEVARQPFVRYLRAVQAVFERRWARALLGPVLVRLVGLDARALDEQYTETELQRVLQVEDITELAEEALAFDRAS